MTIPPKAQSGESLVDLVERFAALYESPYLSDTLEDVKLNRYRAHLAMGAVLSAIRERMLGDESLRRATHAYTVAAVPFEAGHFAATDIKLRAAIAAAVGVGLGDTR